MDGDVYMMNRYTNITRYNTRYIPMHSLDFHMVVIDREGTRESRDRSKRIKTTIHSKNKDENMNENWEMSKGIVSEDRSDPMIDDNDEMETVVRNKKNKVISSGVILPKNTPKTKKTKKKIVLQKEKQTIHSELKPAKNKTRPKKVISISEAGNKIKRNPTTPRNPPKKPPSSRSNFLPLLAPKEAPSFQKNSISDIVSKM